MANPDTRQYSGMIRPGHDDHPAAMLRSFFHDLAKFDICY